MSTLKPDLQVERINTDWEASDIADAAMEIGKQGFDTRVENIYYATDDQDFYFKSSQLQAVGLQIDELETLAQDIAEFAEFDGEDEDFESESGYEFEYLGTSANNLPLYKLTKDEKSFVVEFTS